VRAQAEQSKRDALAEAGAIVADARAQASKLTASAKSRAEQTVRDAEDRKTAIDAQVEAQNAILADTTKAVEAAQSRLDSINSEIAAVKERIGA
jgi:vacuolar-type H+-ATPase subunit E/Vma4